MIDSGSNYAARADGAVKVYGKGSSAVRALDGVSVGFGEGQFTAIMGPSGSGKSTLLHVMAGLDDLTEGRTFIGDVELSGLTEKERTLVRREQIGFVFQAFNLIGTLNGAENIVLPLTIAGRKADEAWYEQVIEALGIRDRLRHRPSELSGGQQQRVAAARALVSRPQIVFADEPSGNLDSKAGAELLTFMRQAVYDFGQTIVMVTHDPSAASYADRVVFLKDGVIVDELYGPSAAGIFDYIKKLEAADA
jgi:putative ABC transport system ATP-binding protein